MLNFDTTALIMSAYNRKLPADKSLQKELMRNWKGAYEGLPESILLRNGVYSGLALQTESNIASRRYVADSSHVIQNNTCRLKITNPLHPITSGANLKSALISYFIPLPTLVTHFGLGKLDQVLDRTVTNNNGDPKEIFLLKASPSQISALADIYETANKLTEEVEKTTHNTIGIPIIAEITNFSWPFGSVLEVVNFTHKTFIVEGECETTIGFFTLSIGLDNASGKNVIITLPIPILSISEEDGTFKKNKITMEGARLLATFNLFSDEHHSYVAKTAKTISFTARNDLGGHDPALIDKFMEYDHNTHRQFFSIHTLQVSTIKLDLEEGEYTKNPFPSAVIRSNQFLDDRKLVMRNWLVKQEGKIKVNNKPLTRSDIERYLMSVWISDYRNEHPHVILDNMDYCIHLIEQGDIAFLTFYLNDYDKHYIWDFMSRDSQSLKVSEVIILLMLMWLSYSFLKNKDTLGKKDNDRFDRYFTLLNSAIACLDSSFYTHQLSYISINDDGFQDMCNSRRKHTLLTAYKDITSYKSNDICDLLNSTTLYGTQSIDAPYIQEAFNFVLEYKMEGDIKVLVKKSKYESLLRMAFRKRETNFLCNTFDEDVEGFPYIDLREIRDKKRVISENKYDPALIPLSQYVKPEVGFTDLVRDGLDAHTKLLPVKGISVRCLGADRPGNIKKFLDNLEGIFIPGSSSIILDYKEKQTIVEHYRIDDGTPQVTLSPPQNSIILEEREIHGVMRPKYPFIDLTLDSPREYDPATLGIVLDFTIRIYNKYIEACEAKLLQEPDFKFAHSYKDTFVDKLKVQVVFCIPCNAKGSQDVYVEFPSFIDFVSVMVLRDTDKSRPFSLFELSL